MRVVERSRHLDRDTDRVLDRELPLALEPRAERLALDVRHHVEEQLVDRPGVVEGKDVRMLQPRGGADFFEETLAAERGGELGPEHLDRDGALVADVVREVDGGHAARAEFPIEPVPVGEGSAKAVVDAGRRGVHRSRN